MEVNLLDLLYSRIFNGNTEISQDRIYFKIEDNTIGTSGNFVTLVGLPKAGKSTFLTAMISSGISSRSCFGFELKLHPEINKKRIGWFDTEQSPYDFSRAVNRVKEFTGMGNDIFNYMDCFLVNSDTTKNIIGMIDTYLATQSQCGILIIDGILDLIDNLNDETASKLLTRKLKKWAKDYNILIITILHLGKKDLSSIGHIGSASDRYAQSTLVIEKTKNNSFTCAGKFLRSAPGFTPIEIYYNNLTGKYQQSTNF